jgi:hypothetical protein
MYLIEKEKDTTMGSEVQEGMATSLKNTPSQSQQTLIALNNNEANVYN